MPAGPRGRCAKAKSAEVDGRYNSSWRHSIPQRRILFNLVARAQHAELALGVFKLRRPALGWMNRMTQFKDEGRQGIAEERAVGLFRHIPNC